MRCHCTCCCGIAHLHNVHRVTKRGFSGDLGEELAGLVGHLDVLLLTPNVKDLAHLLVAVGRRGYDKKTVQQVQRHAVRALVLCAADPRDPAVRCNDQDRCELALERAVEPRKALDVQHVHLVNKQYSRDNGRLAFLTPLGHLAVDLLAHLGLDLSSITGEQGKEALLPRVDHVNLVQAHHVHDLLALLELALGALNEPSLWAHCVVVGRARE
mmetsp:Transcript_4687/g.11992  ORF Transcript_4687/g.11992 Transcript_4687/m.11992 type:complete len:213 (+) Transcript_4687:1938-2576(+)